MGFSVEVENLSSVKKRLDIKVSPEDVVKEIDSAYVRFRNEVKIKGFRKGKVPREIIERLYSDKVKGEVAAKIIAETLAQALEDKAINPVSTPEVEPADLEAGKGFSYSAIVEVMPVIDVKGYEGISTKKEEVVVTEDEIEIGINTLREKHAYFKVIEEDRPVKDGDLAVVDFDGLMDNKPIKDGSVRDYPLLIGSGNLLPAFEKGIIGMRLGEERKLEVEFPEDYRNKGLAGKKGIFNVTLKEIKEKVLPEIDDDFAKDLKAKDLKELREKIREELIRQKEEIEEKKFRKRVFEELIKANPFDIPPTLLEGHTGYLVNQTMNNLYKHGRRPADIEGFIEGFKRGCREKAERDIRTDIILKAIAERESISVTADDVEGHIRSIADKHNESYEHLKRFYRENNLLGNLKMGLLEDRVFDIIKNVSQRHEEHKDG